MESLNANAGAIQAVAGAIQAASTIVLVIVTVYLFRVTRTYADSAERQAQQAKRHVEESQQQRFDQHRPVVVPVGDLALNQDDLLDWFAQGYDVHLQNVGGGAALVVCAVMFPPEGTFPRDPLAQRYTLWREPALLPEELPQRFKLERGRTKMDGDARIGDHRLYAPKRPTRDERTLGGQYNFLARLTLTYGDIFMRKHAAVYDYIDLYGWQCVALLADVATDLEDIDQAADKRMHDSAKQARNVSAAGLHRILRG
jgi:hypothetical protein